jgi:hypothetical protein
MSQQSHVRRMNGEDVGHDLGDNWKRKSDDLFDGHGYYSNSGLVQPPIFRYSRGGRDSGGRAVRRFEKKLGPLDNLVDMHRRLGCWRVGASFVVVLSNDEGAYKGSNVKSSRHKVASTEATKS